MMENTPEKLTNPIVWDAAVVVKDLDKTILRLKELGLGDFVQGGPPEGAEGLFYNGKPLESNMKVCLIRIGNMQMEFIQPDDKPNPWREFLETRGEGIHHIGFQVEDVEKDVERLVGRGAQVPFYGRIKGKTGAAYVDLKLANLIIELTSFNDI